ncbi:MAG: hypothetical protein MUC68_00915 [Burkholderiaceae bacterium]|nr:hypothetical protein [Burkholderiaceae bacterium]
MSLADCAAGSLTFLFSGSTMTSARFPKLLPLAGFRRFSRVAFAGAFVALPVVLCWAQATDAVSARLGPTVQDVVEFTRIIQPEHHDARALKAQVSPDGRRAFIVTRRADVATDVNWFEILLLDLDPGRLATGRFQEPRRLLTLPARRDQDYAVPVVQDARWVGNSKVVFLASVRDAPMQVHALDVATGKLSQLTRSPHVIARFDVSTDLRRIVYVGQLPNPVAPPGSRSVVVANNSFWSVKWGDDDLATQFRRYRYFLAEPGSGRADVALGPDFHQGGQGPRVSVSPDGAWAVVPRYEPARQLAWAREHPFVAETTARIGPASSVDPRSYFSRPSAYVPRRMVAMALAGPTKGRDRTIVDAPDDALSGREQARHDRVWLGGGRSVVIGGTLLPPGEDGSARPGSHIVEYVPASGRVQVVATLAGRLKELRPVAGASDRFIAVEEGLVRHFGRSAQGHWLELADAADREGSTGRAEPAATPSWRLLVREALDQPPQIVAIGPEGQEVALTRLNPGFDRARWGSMRPFVWKDPKGRAWQGGLMLPSGHDPGRRYPLVIQTYGFSPTRFFLDGANVADGFTSGFAGRAFLREGMLVLAMPWSHDGPRAGGERAGLDSFAEGVRGAIDELDRLGLIQRDRVGILGWSATGARVLNLVTFTDVPIRAATMLDGDAHTLFSVTVTYGGTDNILARKRVANEGNPYAETLDNWVRNDPSLHTDCIVAAMRIETYGPWVLNNWDIHALMRMQYKPAEMVVVPRGSHALSRPSERMISLQGNVDWHRFWLRDEERTEPVLPGEGPQELRQQYVRWREMAELKRIDEARPRCARVSATARRD